MATLNCEICTDIEEYYRISAEVMLLKHNLQRLIVNSIKGLQALAPGRIIIINNAV